MIVSDHWNKDILTVEKHSVIRSLDIDGVKWVGGEGAHFHFLFGFKAAVAFISWDLDPENLNSLFAGVFKNRCDWLTRIE